MTQVASNAHRVEILGTPAWLNGQTVSTWFAHTSTLSSVNPENVPGVNPNYPAAAPWNQGTPVSGDAAWTSGGAAEGQPSMVADWNGAVGSPTSLVICAEGGHGNYAGTEAYVFDASATTPTWTRPVNPSTSRQANVAYYNDGKPSSRHGYSAQTYVPNSVISGGRWWSPFGYAFYGTGGFASGKVASYRPGASAYDAQNTYQDFPLAHGGPNGCAVFDSATNLVWAVGDTSASSGNFHSFNFSTGAWSARYGSVFVDSLGTDVSADIDPVRRIFLRYDGTRLVALDLANPTAGPITITHTGSRPTGSAPGLAYDPVSQVFLAWGGGATVYKLTPASTWQSGTWTWSTLTNNGGGATPTSAASNGTYGRFRYLSALRVLIVVNSTTQSTYTYKLPPGAV